MLGQVLLVCVCVLRMWCSAFGVSWSVLLGYLKVWCLAFEVFRSVLRFEVFSYALVE